MWTGGVAGEDRESRCLECRRQEANIDDETEALEHITCERFKGHLLGEKPSL